jgi:hypothetical protein
MADLRQLLGMDTNVRQIASLLKAKAPAGEHLAYINDEEAQLLRDHGGSGRMHEDTGIPSYAYGDDYSYASPSELQNFGGFGLGYEDASPQELSAPENQGFYAPSYQPQTEQYSDYSAGAGGQANPYGLTSSYGGPTTADYSIGNAPSGEQDVAGQGFRFGNVPQGQGMTMGGAPQGQGINLGQGAPSTTPQDPSFLQRTLNAGSQGIDRLTQGIPNAIGNLPEALVRSIPQLLQARQQGKAVQRAAQETQKNVVQPIQQIGQPYTQRGQAGLARAEQGGLTPGQMQQINAARAQSAQGSERRGGIGAQQAQRNLQEMQANMVQQNYQNALQEMAMGDKYLMAAIQAGVLSNKDVAAQTQKLMSNLFYNMLPGTQPVGN